MTNTQPVRLASLKIEDILGDSQLTIPEYQRIYCWDGTDITRFWESIRDLDDLHLGSIILYENGEKKEIVDGQQRLLTLSLMLHSLSDKKAAAAPGPALSLLELETDNGEEIRNIANAKWVIEETLFSGFNDEKVEKIREKILKIQVTQVTVAHEYPDLAYVFFNNQNSKGQELTDFDLLKAHHLRFITNEKDAEMVAKDWARMHGKMAVHRDDQFALHHALGFLVYRLRKLVRRQEYNEDGHYIRDEFQSTDWPKEGLPLPLLEPRRTKPVMYHAPIKGGMDFFDYARYFFHRYLLFEATPVAEKLAEFSSRHRNLYDMAECLLFAYFLKFGNCRLAEALFCICAVLGQYRYGMERITKRNIEQTRESDLIYLIDQSPSPEFFLVQALKQVEKIPPAITPKNAISRSTGSGTGAVWKKGDPVFTLQHVREAWKQNINTIKTDYYATLCGICEELRENFSLEAINTVIKKLYSPK